MPTHHDLCMSRRPSAIGSVSIALFLVSVPSSSHADSWAQGPPSGGYHPDGGSHTYCYKSDFNQGLEANAFHAEDHALEYHTQAATPYDDPCDVSGEPQTDVRWVDAPLGTG